MNEPVAPAVRAECRALSRYVARVDPDETVVVGYDRGLRSPAYLRGERVTPFDSVLLGLAARGPLRAGLADAYARFASPAGPLRRRIVLLIAILESTAPAFEAFEPRTASRLVTIVGLLADGFGFMFRFLAGVLLLAPVHAWCALRSAREHRGPG